MTDDSWRRRRDNEEDFGPPLFSDDDDAPLSFGESDTGPLPHWTQPPTGEVPRSLDTNTGDATDDLDVWSSFSGQSPSWQSGSEGGGGLDDLTGLAPVFDETEPDPFVDGEPTNRDESAPVRREPGKITIGTDPTDGNMSRPPTGRRPRPSDSRTRPPRSGPPPRQPAPRTSGGASGRDMPTAVAVGVLIAAVFIAALLWNPWAVAVLIGLLLFLASIEYFDRVREKGYEPAFLPGVVACAALPAAAYFYGIEQSLPLVLFLASLAMAVTYIGAPSLDSNPMPNMAITALGVAWIGVLGSFGAALAGVSNLSGGNNIGTDTLCVLAIAVVANDVGALFIGSSVGRTPLRAWISPNKSVEGLVGGTLMTLGAMLIVGIMDASDTWNSIGDLLLLGIVVSITAPIGDLTESMFKRNLDVKDFGSIIKGHGGILDRFDGFLFALPATYYLLQVLQPWVS